MVFDPNACPVGQGPAGAPKLLAEAWQRRFMTDPERARQAVELYNAMGFEVKTQKSSPEDFGPDCDDCGKTACRDYLMIYTRRVAVK